MIQSEAILLWQKGRSQEVQMVPGWVWLVGLAALVALLVLGPSTSRTECDQEGKVYVWGYGCVYPEAK